MVAIAEMGQPIIDNNYGFIDFQELSPFKTDANSEIYPLWSQNLLAVTFYVGYLAV
jgi:hypothetical protein